MAFPTDWLRKQAITIDNTKVSGSSALTDFIVRVTLDHLDAEIVDAGANSALNGGGDLRFSSDSAGVTQLACEVVSFVTNASAPSRECEVYVKVPSVSSSVDTTFYIWYDATGETQPAVSDTYGRNAVWSDRTGVYNFSSLNDSTGSNDLTLSGSAAISGGELTTGSGDSAYASDANQLEGQSSFSYHVVCNTGTMTQTGTDSPHRFFDKNGGVMAAGLTSSNFRTWNQSWTNISFTAGNSTDVDIWVTADGTDYSLYNDGSLVNTATQPNSTGTGTGDLVIGNGTTTGTTVPWVGTIDNFSFINGTTVSADWIATEYNNTSAPSSFATAGTPEPATGDGIDPVLSSPTGVATGDTTATGTVITDELNGTLYYYASTNATETAATIKASGSSQAVS